MSKIEITRGLPGSGKSTYAKAWVAQQPEKRVRVNRDAIRWTQGIRTGVGGKAEENLVSVVEKAIVVGAIKEGKDIVIDATHLNDQRIRDWFKLAKIHGVRDVRVIDFDVPVTTAIARDIVRKQTGGRYVGREVIEKMAERAKIGPNGELPKAPVFQATEVFEFKPYVTGQTPAWSFDIDGTLAIMQGRSPYDTSRYMEDTADRAITQILRDLQDADKYDEVTWIGLSGRSEEFYDVTREWLDGWGIRLDHLFMRKKGDSRNDSIVKSELVDEHISGKYDVIAHFDDRQRVVDALRAKGMKVLQVAPGDF